MSSGAELRAAGIIVPANPKNPVAKAEHIEMPDGKRLSEFNPVSSWNDLTDKPFGEVDAFEPIVWDGDTEGRESVDLSDAFGAPPGSAVFYRIADTEATLEEYIEMSVACTYDGKTEAGEVRHYQSDDVTATVALFDYYASIIIDDWGTHEDFAGGYIMVVSDETNGIAAGVFCWQNPQAGYTPHRIEIFNKSVRPIDPKYLPDDAPEIKAAESGAVLEPGVWYEFGEVGELNVTLAQKDDGKAHEYWFDFEPAEGFAGLNVTPEPRWMVDPQYPVGKRCLVGIVMGMAVMGIV